MTGSSTAQPDAKDGGRQGGFVFVGRCRVECVLRGPHSERRQIGIDQGSAYSPIALNSLLHSRLDVPFSAGAANPPWLRYADNLLYACQVVSEGSSALASAAELLANAGMTLKSESTRVADLRQVGTEILGFTVKASNGISHLDQTEVSYDQERPADADPTKVSYDQKRISYTDPNKVSYGQNTVESANLIKVSYDQERLACANPTEVSYVDPINVSYGDQIAVSYADPINVSYGISEQAWKNLVKTLSAAYHCPNPYETAYAILLGWINVYGPTFESVKEQSVVDRIRGLAAGIGFREMSPRDLEQHIQSAQVQWRSFRGRYGDKGGCMVPPLMDAAAPPAPDPAGDVYC